MRLNRKWCKLKHSQTCLCYDQVARFPLNRAVKSFREFPSHTINVTYTRGFQDTHINNYNKVSNFVVYGLTPRCYTLLETLQGNFHYLPIATGQQPLYWEADIFLRETNKVKN